MLEVIVFLGSWKIISGRAKAKRLNGLSLFILITRTIEIDIALFCNCPLADL